MDSDLSQTDALIRFTIIMLLKVFSKTLRDVFNLQNHGVMFVRHLKITLSKMQISKPRKSTSVSVGLRNLHFNTDSPNNPHSHSSEIIIDWGS